MPKISEGTLALTGVAAFAIWLFVALPILYLPTHANHKNEPHSSEAAKTSNAEPKGTEAAPFFVQVIPSPKPAEERTQEADDREEKKDADRWLVRWTFALFAATIGLILATGVLGYFAYRQAGDMKASVDAAHRGADAAYLNAESIINSERAFLFLQIQEHNLDGMVAGAAVLDPDDDYTTGAIGVRYAFRNYGRTAAIIKEVSHRLVHKVGLPKIPEYDPISPLLIEHIVAQNEVSQPLYCAIESTINVTDAKSIAKGDSTLWLYGYVAYDDAFGWGRELRYIWHFNGGSGGFRLYSYREHKAKHAKP